VNIQEAFDRAVRGLASQGFRRSVLPGTSDGVGVPPLCAYTSEVDGAVRHCAFGWLIDDIAIPLDSLSSSVDELLEEVPTVIQRIEQIPNAFLRALQEAHDDAHLDLESRVDHPEGMIANLRDLAECWGLNTSVLEEVANAAA
jgi:hypothetical protein